jgi:3D (Asp-Asp-Asp) domain-containing protein
MRCPGLMVVGLALFVVGCTGTNAVKNKTASYAKEVASRTGRTRAVRTTAYTHTERGHRAYGASNALGTRLQCADVSSAASDWSILPVGTMFRIVDTNKTYVIDDYGSALVGKNTVDLYMPSRLLMRRWGARDVAIEILQEGSYEKSLEVLEPRKRNPHVKQMVLKLQKKLAKDSDTY